MEPADDPAEREQQLQFELERKRRWLERYKRQQRKLEREAYPEPAAQPAAPPAPPPARSHVEKPSWSWSSSPPGAEQPGPPLGYVRRTVRVAVRSGKDPLDWSI